MLAFLQILRSLTFVNGQCKGVHVLLHLSNVLGDKLIQKKGFREDFRVEKSLRNSMIQSQGLGNSVGFCWQESRNEHCDLRTILL